MSVIRVILAEKIRIMVEENFDIGGHGMVSGGLVHLGGGHSVQRRNGVDDSAEQVFQDSLQILLGSNHPRARPFTAAEIDRMDLGRSFDIYRDRFADAGDFTFVFVGNFTPEELRPLVEFYLATLPATVGTAAAIAARRASF